jgi:hypothetical protein
MATPPYLGISPLLGYQLGYELFGRRGEEEAQRKQLQQLQALLQQLRPTTTPVPQTTQEPTGRYQVGPPIGETTPSMVSQPMALSDTLTAPGAGVPWVPPPERGTQVGLPAPREMEDQGPLYGSSRMALFERAAQERRGLPGDIGFALGPPPDVPPPPPRPMAPSLPAEPPPVELAGPYPRREPIERVPVLGPETAPVTRMVPTTRPGRELLDVIAENPQMLAVLKAYPGLLPLIAQERERQEWEGVLPTAGPATPSAAALAGGPGVSAPAGEAPPRADLQSQRAGLRRSLDVMLNNPQLLGTKRGQELLSQLKTASEVLTAEEKGETERVTAAEVKDFRTRALAQAAEADARGDPVDAMRWRAMAQNPTQATQILKDRDVAQQTTARRDLFTQYAADERRRGNDAGAQIYEAAALDKESAEIVFKHRDAARKEALEGTGGAAWKPWRDTFGEDVAGELAATPGLQPHQVTDVHIRRAIDNVNREKASRATAGAPKVAVDVKWGPQESEDLSNQLVAVDNYRRVAELIRKHPEGWGGPGGLIGKVDKLLAAGGWGDAERTRARLDIEQSSSLLRRAITGTAMAAHEARLTEWIPTGTESLPLLLAKLEATATNIERAIYYRVQLKKGVDPTKLPKLPKMATPAGDVDLTAPETPPPAPPAPPAAGRSPAGQSARERLQEHGILPGPGPTPVPMLGP